MELRPAPYGRPLHTNHREGEAYLEELALTEIGITCARADALPSRRPREGELCVPKGHCVPDSSLGETDQESHTTETHVIAGILLNLHPSGEKLKIRT